jgi:hypothetical protein
MTRRTTWTRLDDTMEDLLPRVLVVRLSVHSESCWDCEIKFITHPSNPGVDKGVTLYKAAGETAEEVLRACLDELDHLLASEVAVNQAISDVANEEEER